LVSRIRSRSASRSRICPSKAAMSMLFHSQSATYWWACLCCHRSFSWCSRHRWSTSITRATENNVTSAALRHCCSPGAMSMSSAMNGSSPGSIPAALAIARRASWRRLGTRPLRPFRKVSRDIENFLVAAVSARWHLPSHAVRPASARGSRRIRGRSPRGRAGARRHGNRDGGNTCPRRLRPGPTAGRFRPMQSDPPAATSQGSPRAYRPFLHSLIPQLRDSGTSGAEPTCHDPSGRSTALHPRQCRRGCPVCHLSPARPPGTRRGTARRPGHLAAPGTAGGPHCEGHRHDIVVEFLSATSPPSPYTRNRGTMPWSTSSHRTLRPASSPRSAGEVPHAQIRARSLLGHAVLLRSLTPRAGLASRLAAK
jgi:hypothetical protein